MRDHVPGLATLSEAVAGLSKHRTLPRWRSDTYRHGQQAGPEAGPPVILFADTFNTYHEAEKPARRPRRSGSRRFPGAFTIAAG
jgi:hypothetical protein